VQQGGSGMLGRRGSSVYDTGAFKHSHHCSNDGKSLHRLFGHSCRESNANDPNDNNATTTE
jgi:hypothetical protein